MANGVLKVNVGGTWFPIGPGAVSGGGSGGGGAHHVTHETGGTDAIVNLDTGVITSGSLSDARLSANVLKVSGGFPGGTTSFLRADCTFVIPTVTTSAHHATHEPGGSDPLSNSVWTNAANSFTNINYFGGEVDITGGSGTNYSTAPLEIRTTLTPRLSFHWPGVVASQIGMDSAGVIRTYDNPGTGYERFACSDIYEKGRVNP